MACACCGSAGPQCCCIVDGTTGAGEIVIRQAGQCEGTVISEGSSTSCTDFPDMIIEWCGFTLTIECVVNGYTIQADVPFPTNHSCYSAGATYGYYGSINNCDIFCGYCRRSGYIIFYENCHGVGYRQAKYDFYVQRGCGAATFILDNAQSTAPPWSYCGDTVTVTYTSAP